MSDNDMTDQKETPFYKKPKIVYPGILGIILLFLAVIIITGLWNPGNEPYLPAQLDPLYELQGRFPKSRIVFFSFPEDLHDIQIFMNGVWVEPVFPDGRYYSDGKRRYAHLVMEDVPAGKIHIGDWKTLTFTIQISKSDWCWAIDVYRDPETDDLKLKSKEMPDWGAY